MAITQETEFGTLIIPGAYPTFEVNNSSVGLATTGVLMLVGEASRGPVHSLEESLALNSFGPDQLALVRAKYGSGPLVDAFEGAVVPMADAQVPGSFFRAVLVKTNDSASARAKLLASDGSSNYLDVDSKAMYLAAVLGGKDGNLIKYRISNGQNSAQGVPLSGQQEVLPSTGSFSWICSEGTIDFGMRDNGGAHLLVALSANTDPAEFVAAINAAHAGTPASGGTTRTVGGTSMTAAIAVVSNTDPDQPIIKVTLAATGLDMSALQPGDTFFIADNSVLSGSTPQANDRNTGCYLLTQVVSNENYFVGQRKSRSDGTLTSTSVLGAQAIAAQSITMGTQLKVFAPVEITQDLASNAVIDGIGKTLELYDLGTGADALLDRAFVVSSAGAISEPAWVSQSSSAALIHSGSDSAVAGAAEEQVSLELVRANEPSILVEDMGGRIAFELGYVGTTATVSISDDTLTTSVTGGSGAGLSLALSDYPTISELAAFINSQTGYTARSVGQLAGKSPTILDNVSAQGICSQYAGITPGRIKADGWDFGTRVLNESVHLKLVDVADSTLAHKTPVLGLPGISASNGEAFAYLSGGSKGGTTQAQFQAALDALEKIRGNFVVPLFSRDASDDIVSKITESSSTYSIAAIVAACKTHVIKMSSLKRRRNRQAFCSIQTTFNKARGKGEETNHYRVALAFQDVRVSTAAGLVQKQPWMNAVKAAASQAAALNKSIFAKQLNVNGFIQAAKDFDELDDTQIEQALLSGLLVGRAGEAGGFEYVSDQTTYVQDGNFVFNSIQAVYAADTVALSTAQQMERSFKGRSLADISANVALSRLEAILRELKRTKWLAASDDAPDGFKNAKVLIQGKSMFCEAEIKLGTSLYFIPIRFLISEVVSAA